MSNVSRLYVKWLMVAAALAMVAVVSIPVRGQSAPSAAPLGGGTIDDWSHHRLIYSSPGTEQDAIKNGTYSHWWKIVNQSRFAMQQTKRSLGTKTLDETSVGKNLRGESLREEPGAPEFGRLGFQPIEPRRVDPSIPERLRPVGDVKTDWNEALAVGQVQPNTYPAKFSFTTNTFSCTSDFVVYPTGQPARLPKRQSLPTTNFTAQAARQGQAAEPRPARQSRFRRCSGHSIQAPQRFRRHR